MNPIATLLPGRRTAAFPPPHRPPSADVDLEEPACRACGWYDSSNDLRIGLVVSEHDGVDAIASELPLADWIGLQLAGWRA